MQLFTVTVDEWQPFFKVLNGLTEFGMNGLVFSSHNIRNEITHHQEIEPVPMFGFLSKMLKPSEYSKSFTAVIVLDDEKLDAAKKIVRETTTELKHKALMMALPITFCEEISEA